MLEPELSEEEVAARHRFIRDTLEESSRPLSDLADSYHLSLEDDSVSSASTASTPIMNALTPARQCPLLPGSVLATYLADPIVNPAARIMAPPDTVRLDHVRTLEHVLTKSGSQEGRMREMPCTRGTPETSAFLALMNDMRLHEDMLLGEEGCCCRDEVTVLPPRMRV